MMRSNFSQTQPAGLPGVECRDWALRRREGLPRNPTLHFRTPAVEIDNREFSDRTVLTVDSANRPGTLVEVRVAQASLMS